MVLGLDLAALQYIFAQLPREQSMSDAPIDLGAGEELFEVSGVETICSITHIFGFFFIL